MDMNFYIKKKRMIFTISYIVLILIVIISLYIYNKKEKEASNIKEQDFNITYNISKDQLIPMDKNNGSINAPLSTIKIKNSKTYRQLYKLVITSGEKSTLELSKIYILIDNEIYTLEDFNNGEGYISSIEPNEEQIVSFKIWIASDLIDETDENKILSLKYEIIKQD